MAINLILVPYDSGKFNARMGQGPDAFSKGGVAERLIRTCGAVETAIITAEEEFPREIGTTFELLRGVSEEVQRAVSENLFPLVLSGNCISTVGAVSGLMPLNSNTGLIWFDAHGDFHTPGTTASGFLDAMALSIIVGHCWEAISETIPGFQPVPENQVLLIGGRDFEVKEIQRLRASVVNNLTCEEIQANLEKAVIKYLRQFPDNIEQVYLHVDLDVHNPDLAPANQYKPEGGLTPEEVIKIITLIGDWMPIVGATLSAYDPDADPEKKGLLAGLDLAEKISLLGTR